MKYIFLFLLFLTSGLSISNAQSGSIVLDLMVKREFTLNSQGGIDTSSVKALVNFKISNVDSTEKVFILIGSAKDSSDILFQQVDKVSSLGVNYLSYNGQNESLLANIESSHFFTFSTNQWKSARYVTVFLKDISGNYSSRIYFEKKY